MFISDEADYVAMSARIPPPLRNFQLCIFVQDFRREHAENSGGMPKPTCRAPAEIFSKLSLRVFAFLAQRSDRGAGHIRKKRTAESIVFVGTRKKIPESLLRTSDRCLGAKPGVGRGRCRRVFGTRWRFGAAALPHLLRKVRLCFESGGQLVQIFFYGAHVPELKVGSCPCWPSIKDRRLQRRWQPLEQMGTRASKSDFQKHCFTTNETEQNTKGSKIIK